MGKKRVAVIGDVETEEQARKAREVKRQQKTLREGEKLSKVQEEKAQRLESEAKETKAEKTSHGVVDASADMEAEFEAVKQKQVQAAAQAAAAAEEAKAATRKPKHPNRRGKNYRTARSQITPGLTLALAEAIEKLQTASYTTFTSTVELHVNFIKADVFSSTTIDLPHETGKAKRLALLTPETLQKIKDNKIDFDILFASPAQMGQLVPFARVLGPRGLMPNPKTGTLVENPEKAAGNYSNTTTNLKPEAKAPILHTVAGNLKMKPDHIADNIRTILTTIGTRNIKSAYIAGTMSPSVRIDLASL